MIAGPARPGRLPRASRYSSRDMPRARVLVVEDDRAIREGLADALAFHGYAAVQAERGDIGLEKALHGGCDLVILDLVLPGARRAGRPARAAPRAPDAARHHPDRARRRERPRARPARRGGRLRGEALQHPRAARPRRRRAAPLARSGRRDVRSLAPSPGPRGPRAPGGRLRRRHALRALGARGRAAALPGREPGAHRLARGAALARVGRQPAAPWRRARSTCTWRGCATSCATTTGRERVLVTVRGKGYRLDARGVMRPALVWLVFAACVAAVLGAMVWSSASVLRLERAERAGARAGRARGERPPRAVAPGLRAHAAAGAGERPPASDYAPDRDASPLRTRRPSPPALPGGARRRDVLAQVPPASDEARCAARAPALGHDRRLRRAPRWRGDLAARLPREPPAPVGRASDGRRRRSQACVAEDEERPGIRGPAADLREATPSCPGRLAPPRSRDRWPPREGAPPALWVGRRAAAGAAGRRAGARSTCRAAGWTGRDCARELLASRPATCCPSARLRAGRGRRAPGRGAAPRHAARAPRDRAAAPQLVEIGTSPARLSLAGAWRLLAGRGRRGGAAARRAGAERAAARVRLRGDPRAAHAAHHLPPLHGHARRGHGDAGDPAARIHRAPARRGASGSATSWRTSCSTRASRAGAAGRRASSSTCGRSSRTCGPGWPSARRARTWRWPGRRRPPRPRSSQVDRSAVEQVLLNLVDNACKYAAASTPPRIHVALATSDGRALLRVSDHGPGLSRADRRRLFQPFSKSDREAANSAPGIGLGLALSRRLARAQGGDLLPGIRGCGGGRLRAEPASRPPARLLGGPDPAGADHSRAACAC